MIVDGKLKLKIKSRPISYASHVDSNIYSYYAHKLSLEYERKIAEHDISDCILAFRKLNKSNIDFAREAFLEIKKIGNCTAIALDISGFFDNLCHKHLKKSLCCILNEESLSSDYYAVFKSLTKYSYCDRDDVFKKFDISPNNPWNGRRRICNIQEFREIVKKNNLIQTNVEPKGIPQGSPISALLSNIFMLNFDIKINALAKEYGGSYRRYCDDMLLILSENIDSAYLENLIGAELATMMLSLNKDKTEIRTFTRVGGYQTSKKSLQYLGFTYDGARILLRSSALAKFSGRMNKSLRLVANTMKSEYCATGIRPKLKRKKLYERYSHLGHQNFVRYGIRSSEKMNSKDIRKQLKPLWNRLQTQMNDIS